MTKRILLFFIMLGSFSYGIVAVGSSARVWQRAPAAITALEQMATPAAQRQAAYLHSLSYRGQLGLTFMSGVLFLAGAMGLCRRATWGRMTLFGGAWMALAQMAWTLITSLEWFRATGAGMLYQVNLLNCAWVLLVLALAPTERLVR